jgi:hypothetical protein
MRLLNSIRTGIKAGAAAVDEARVEKARRAEEAAQAEAAKRLDQDLEELPRRLAKSAANWTRITKGIKCDLCKKKAGWTATGPPRKRAKDDYWASRAYSKQIPISCNNCGYRDWMTLK